MSPTGLPSQESCVVNNEVILRRTRKIRRHVPHSLRPAEFVLRRNLRERRRVDAVNKAFTDLKTVLPLVQEGDRVSKMAILRQASMYIQYLSHTLNSWTEGKTLGHVDWNTTADLTGCEIHQTQCSDHSNLTIPATVHRQCTRSTTPFPIQNASTNNSNQIQSAPTNNMNQIQSASTYNYPIQSFCTHNSYHKLVSSVWQYLESEDNHNRSEITVFTTSDEYH